MSGGRAGKPHDRRPLSPHGITISSKAAAVVGVGPVLDSLTPTVTTTKNDITNAPGPAASLVELTPPEIPPVAAVSGPLGLSLSKSSFGQSMGKDVAVDTPAPASGVTGADVGTVAATAMEDSSTPIDTRTRTAVLQPGLAGREESSVFVFPPVGDDTDDVAKARLYAASYDSAVTETAATNNVCRSGGVKLRGECHQRRNKPRPQKTRAKHCRLVSCTPQ